MLQVIGVIALSVLITMAFMVIYFGLLSRFTDWLICHHRERIRRLLRQPIPLHPINNVGDSGDETRNEGGIIVCYINCFEQGYHLLKAWIGRLRYSIGKLKVSKDGCHQNEQCHEEYRGYNIQKLLHTLTRVSVLASILGSTLAHKPRQSAVALRKIVHHMSQFVCHLHQEQRNETEDAELLPPLYLEDEGIWQRFYLGTGVGVYQGEFVTIQQWALSNPAHWVIGTLHFSDFHLLKIGLVYRLLRLAVILGNHLRFDSLMSDLKSRDEMRRWSDCPHTIEPQWHEASYSVDDVNATCPLLYRLLEQLRRSNQECPTTCPFIAMINQEYWSVNQSGKEPVEYNDHYTPPRPS